ncbi:hypothetical protein ITJ43_14780 [Microbacterium sp. VKM Ac-2870]|uniref:hypothetical protein n=1 Tax=Microbacterium sp. VKM Ac-2870 TaxID=2783825 RepID=UPI00188AD8A4|nr:hypothetical protein [Microbacterium sp. VKM Ac-2870]MBF4563395.1 hypothetical protein [Microbacterium sp. VKM Ac-2870]
MDVTQGISAAGVERTSAVSIHWILAFALLQFLITAFSAVTMYLRPLSVAACSDTCDYDSLAGAVNTFFVIVGVVVVTTLVCTFALRRRGWWVLAPLAVGSAVTLAAYLITDAISLRAVGL